MGILEIFDRIGEWTDDRYKNDDGSLKKKQIAKDAAKTGAAITTTAFGVDMIIIGARESRKIDSEYADTVKRYDDDLKK